jgi:mannose-6-phosphate isomerase-like protein (cupin superfamily)
MFPTHQEIDMKGYIADIETLTEDNNDFRKVLYTGHHLQLVLMALKPGQDIGVETHETHDQFFRIEQGKGLASIDGVAHKVKSGDCVIVPAGAAHNLTNSGDKILRVYTLYGPPEHLDGVTRKTKAEADAQHEAFDGVATE